MQERKDTVSYDNQRFLRHLRLTAEMLEVPFSEATTMQMLELFSEGFQNGAVQTKITSRPESSVYYRFFYRGPVDFKYRAQKAGLIPLGEPPPVALLGEALGTFPTATPSTAYDFDVQTGLAKIWCFLGGPVPLNQLLALRSLPESVRLHSDLFERYGLSRSTFVCSDFQKNSMNVYFRRPGPVSPEWIKSLIRETGGQEVPANTIQEITDWLPTLVCLAMTFSWNDPTLLRWCIYSLETPFHLAQQSPIRLPILPPRLVRFRDETPTLNEHPQFNVAWSFGREGHYMKFEKSYARDVSYYLTHEYGCDYTRPLLQLSNVGT